MRNLICPHCKAKILWLPMSPDGHSIPVNFAPVAPASSALVLIDSIGWLIKDPECRRAGLRYRSHLLDCKALAKALHKTTVISLGKDEPKVCFKCHETGHFANECPEDEATLKELDFQ